MNLILLTPDEARQGGLPADDPRTRHVREVLRSAPGDRICVGEMGGRRGLATLEAVGAEEMRWTIVWEEIGQTPLPLALLVGLPRPQTARKILHDTASLGAARLDFFQTEKGDPAYAQSTLWRSGEAEELLRKGTAQAFSTLVPERKMHASLADALAGKTPGWAQVFLDVYEAAEPLDAVVRGAKGAVLAIGPERGWSAKERDALRAAGFVGAHLGDRVLRVETACVAAGAVALAALGAWTRHFRNHE